jgi:hypothetical protein
VRVQAAFDREHGWSISFTLCRGCTLYPQFVFPILPGLARPLNTSKVSGQGLTMKPLQRKEEKPTACDSYSSGRTITLPNGQHLSKGCYPRRTGLYPCNPEPPVPLSEKGYQLTHSPNYLAKPEPCGLWLYCCLGWFSMFHLNLRWSNLNINISNTELSCIIIANIQPSKKFKQAKQLSTQAFDKHGWPR